MAEGAAGTKPWPDVGSGPFNTEPVVGHAFLRNCQLGLQLF